MARAIQILFTYGNKGPQTSKGRKAGRPKGAKTMTVFFPALFLFSNERKKTGVAFCRPRAQLPTLFPEKRLNSFDVGVYAGWLNCVACIDIEIATSSVVSFQRMMIFQGLL